MMLEIHTVSEEQKVTAKVEAAPKGAFERIIEDPFASAFAATGATALAVCTVLSGMWLINTAV